MLLIRLTYFSRNRLGCGTCNMDRGLADILATSVTNNLRDNITGVLIGDDHWFAQVLEGIEAKVSATFERILQDTRHSDITLVTMQAVSERRYSASAMAGIIRDQDNGDLFRHYGEHESFDPREMRADRLSDLIEEVVRRGTTRGSPWITRSSTSVA